MHDVLRGVQFSDYHSYEDWGLLLVEKTISAPEPKTKIVDVPGMDGVLDLTEALGAVRYGNRELKFRFKVIDRERFYNAYTTVATYLHGRKRNIIIDDDPGFYYVGRCTMGDLKPGKIQSYFDVEVDAEPYKYETDDAMAQGRWLWDTFNFRTGIAQDTQYTVSGTQTITLINRGMAVNPTFTASASMSVRYKGTTYSIPNGTTTNYNILLDAGENTLTVTGTGTLTISYRGGAF